MTDAIQSVIMRYAGPVIENGAIKQLLVLTAKYKASEQVDLYELLRGCVKKKISVETRCLIYFFNVNVGD